MAYVCPNCQGTTESLIWGSLDIEVDEYHCPCVVEQLLMERCEKCGHTALTKQGEESLKSKRRIFEQGGIDSKIDEFISRRGIYKNRIAEAMDMSPQNFHKRISFPQALTQRTLYAIGKVLNLGPGQMMEYYNIEHRDGKNYIGSKFGEE